MKKIIAWALCLVALFTVISCASTKTTEAPKPANSTETASVEISSNAETSASESETAPEETTPDPTESASETVVDEHEKKLYNTAVKTEDDLDVIHVGVYEFVLADGRKLAYEGDEITLAEPSAEENCRFMVSFQNSGKDKTGRTGVRYVLYTGDTVKRSLNAYYSSIYAGEANDRYVSNNWYIEEHGEGVVSLRNVGSDRYIGLDDAGGVTVRNDREDFTMKLISEGTSCFDQTISEKGNIVVRTNEKIKRRARLSNDRLAKLANDLQTAYETYYELTDYLVWESIIVRIYQNEPYFGYIYPTWNVISFDLPSALTDMGKMPERDKIGLNDWSFCLLHEMGHMFDAGRGWKFHGEFATNLKVAYVLYRNSDVGACAATAEWPYNVCYDGEHIKDMWNKIPKMTRSSGFNLDRLLYIFVTYAERIGWDNMIKTYHEIQHLEEQETDKVKCYWLFTNTMQKYAPDGVHVNDTMEKGELEIILKELENS